MRRRPALLRVLVGLATRNLRRNLRRTVLTASAMVLGGALLMLTFSLSDGGQELWITSGVRLGSGHVSVEKPEFRSTQKIEDRLPSEIRHASIRAIESPEIAPHVIAASARLSINGLASSASGARPVRVVAVDPNAESGFSTVDEKTVDGRYLEHGDRLHAYIGVGLASSLDLRLGSRFVVQAQDTEREIAGQLFRVVGTFKSGVPEIDQSMIHIPLETAGEWLGSNEDVTNVGFVLTDSKIARRVATRLRDALQEPVDQGNASVLEWREAHPSLASAIAIDDFGRYVTNLLIFTIIAFGIMNTVLMSVLHRHREFGVLQALGLTPGQTSVIVLVEGLMLTVISGALGASLGLFGTWYFIGDGIDMSHMMEDMTVSGVAVDPIIVPVFRAHRILECVLFIVIVGAVASIYPAFRAAKIDVTEVMKFDR